MKHKFAESFKVSAKFTAVLNVTIKEKQSFHHATEEMCLVLVTSRLFNLCRFLVFVSSFSDLMQMSITLKS